MTDNKIQALPRLRIQDGLKRYGIETWSRLSRGSVTELAGGATPVPRLGMQFGHSGDRLEIEGVCTVSLGKHLLPGDALVKFEAGVGIGVAIYLTPINNTFFSLLCVRTPRSRWRS
jgi:hypothetical protein